MANSKVVKLANKKDKDGKRKGRKARFPAVAKGNQPPLANLLFSPASSLHPRFAAMFLDRDRFLQQFHHTSVWKKVTKSNFNWFHK